MITSPQDWWKTRKIGKREIKRFILLKMISVIMHSLWALWLCSQKHWTNNFHHAPLAAVVSWTNQRMFLFKAVTPPPLSTAMPGPWGCKHQEGCNSLLWEFFQIPRTNTHNLHEEKRTIMDAHKVCQEWGNLLAAKSNYLAFKEAAVFYLLLSQGH